MNALQAIVLGLVQGLTEFLPVSSSGHLVIVQTLFNIDSNMLVFDVFVHLGTLVAVFVAFREDIWGIIKKPISHFTGLILVGCIPAAVMGLLLDDIFESLFSSIVAVAIALIITGFLLMISDRFNGKKTIDEMKYSEALLVGFFQGCAITPGLSRSGSTIFGALLCGLRRKDAARFSFIVSIPVILGAALKSILDSMHSGITISGAYFLGAAVAAISGYFAIRVFLKLLSKRNMHYFSYYVWAVALIILVSRIFV